ncbi:MAG: hypothetical protein EPN79_03565 [Burkholderiaceae bacterium]|nr:MAG: hypothetical protein EPN79_03565 [Burkholderiaceae bacterium]TBR77591.1 MAG: hypothetical protein EPN64_01795 [Burkholderiaceae bacterium]
MIEFFTALTTAAWLVPNHYVPWLSAWSDAVAIVALFGLLPCAALAARAAGRISWRLPAVAVLCWAVLLGQLASGKILYAGDALMAALYLGLWLAAVLAGAWLAGASIKGSTRQQMAGSGDALDALAAAWLFAAIVSVGIALVQWTGAIHLGIYGADLPPGARPFANVGQPNHFCTLCFLGLCGLLWLQQRQRVRGAAFWLAAGFLLWGMAMSQSRTGWLQIALLVLWGLALHARAGLCITRAQLLTFASLFVAAVLLWPWACDVLMLSPGRPLADQMSAGVRLPYWWAMLDAVGRQPLWGYGWQQVGAAQQNVALAHPVLGTYFDHSHNLVLDLLLWNGIPLGGVIIVLLVWWFAAHIRACRDARAAWLLAAVGGVVTHAMLEYPLDYAYFLIPVGLAMGAIEVFAPTGARLLRVPRGVALGLALLLAVVFAGVASDYVKAEQNDRIQRFELAHIGTDRVHTPVPKLRLLTQLEAYLQIAHADLAPGMSPAQLEALRRAALRWGYPATLGRYALALALNGQPQAAARELQVLRKIWGNKAYAWSRAQFEALAAGKYPQLRAVSLPSGGGQ